MLRRTFSINFAFKTATVNSKRIQREKNSEKLNPKPKPIQLNSMLRRKGSKKKAENEIENNEKNEL